MERLLLVFMKNPEPGAAKTRLIPALGPEGAARIHARMIERTLARVVDPPPWALGWRTEVRVAGADAATSFTALARPLRSEPQGPGDLGARLRAGFAAAFRSGADAVAAIGTDCPELGAADVGDAFGLLEHADAVFGPALDGGYWLVGLRKAAFERGGAALFHGIGWGGPDVLAASLAAASRAGLRVRLARRLADVDRPEDLARWERALRADGAGTAITVVVPALEEAPSIGGLVGQLRAEDGVEVVVADGDSPDGTAAVAAAAGARVVACARRGRAAQMNAGAAVASGEILVFLHADTRLPRGWPAAVRRLLEGPDVAGGAFTFATDSPRRALRWIEAGAALRARALGAIFGDQAIFTRTGTFVAVGGFPDQELMEDWELVRRLRRRGTVAVLPQKAVTSARRWERRGTLRTSLTNAAITAAYLAGVSPGRLASWYRGRPA